MTLASEAGLADPTCQLYMAFYYIGPASIILTLWNSNEKSMSWTTLSKTACLAVVDVVAQTMNYTGSVFAGPTIFAIVYSSVTVWCAVLSRVLLGSHISCFQWLGVMLVFGGLALAAIGSASLGAHVFHGAMLITLGSCLHALMYVMSESIMNRGEKVSSRKYCAVFASVACFLYLLWQLTYTRAHFQELVLDPMTAANTSVLHAMIILLSISFASCVHSLTFFHTVKYFPGGATSAGIMKGAQAIIVFVASALLFCGHIGGAEMCFTAGKMAALVVVIVGLVVYGKATEIMKEYNAIETYDVEV
eukprot:CAMPEP_0195524450 /NCGR_PEP_ID=MMETSP0794_2-20130614/24281_1 /TAXON_ID=515487 /ORGANISM="Stephanopyxis turris, Strain CCMP 815" /LENGTH=304 /DNA_ID=CAMNT_0040654671 /DNA_START=367 /DNA_END=1281 /DNA_ORIENTATION=+